MVADSRSPSVVGVTTRVHPATRVGQQGGIDARGGEFGGSTEKVTGFGVTTSESAGVGPGVLLPQLAAPSSASAPVTRARFREGIIGIVLTVLIYRTPGPPKKPVNFPSVHAGGTSCPEAALECRRGGDGRRVGPCRRAGAGLRQTDTVARVGSDEFTILLPELASPVDATRVAEKLLRAVSSPVVLGG